MPKLSFQFFKKDDKKSEKKKKKQQKQTQEKLEAPKVLPKISSNGRGRKLLRPGSFADKKKKASERFMKRKKKMLQRTTSNSSVGKQDPSTNAYLDSRSSENLFDTDPFSYSKDYGLASTAPQNPDYGYASTTPRNGDYGYPSTTPRNGYASTTPLNGALDRISESNSSFWQQHYLSEQERLHSGGLPRLTNSGKDIRRRSISFDAADSLRHHKDEYRHHKDEYRKNLSADGVPQFRSEMQFSYDDQYYDDEPMMHNTYTPRSKGLSALDFDDEPRFTPTSRSGILREPSHSAGGIGVALKYFSDPDVNYGGGRFDYNTSETPNENQRSTYAYEMCVE